MSSCQDSYQTCEIWCRSDIACIISVKLVISCCSSRWRYDYNGILPLDVFRPAAFIKHMKLGQIEHSMFELYKAWRILLPTGGAMIITEYWPLGFRPWLLPNMEVWCILTLMLILCKISHFLLPAGGAIIIMQYWPLDVFRPGPLSNLISLGRSYILGWVTTTCIPMARHRTLSRHHGHALQRKLKIFTI